MGLRPSTGHAASVWGGFSCASGILGPKMEVRIDTNFDERIPVLTNAEVKKLFNAKCEDLKIPFY